MQYESNVKESLAAVNRGEYFTRSTADRTREGIGESPIHRFTHFARHLFTCPVHFGERLGEDLTFMCNFSVISAHTDSNHPDQKLL